jgi:hypothetical protein
VRACVCFVFSTAACVTGLHGFFFIDPTCGIFYKHPYTRKLLFHYMIRVRTTNNSKSKVARLRQKPNLQCAQQPRAPRKTVDIACSSCRVQIIKGEHGIRFSTRRTRCFTLYVLRILYNAYRTRMSSKNVHTINRVKNNHDGTRNTAKIDFDFFYDVRFTFRFDFTPR